MQCRRYPLCHAYIMDALDGERYALELTQRNPYMRCDIDVNGPVHQSVTAIKLAGYVYRLLASMGRVQDHGYLAATQGIEGAVQHSDPVRVAARAPRETRGESDGEE
jgi:hypothetical protein